MEAIGARTIRALDERRSMRVRSSRGWGGMRRFIQVGAWLGLSLVATGCAWLPWSKPDPFESYRDAQDARREADEAALRERAGRTIEERIETADSLRASGRMDRAVWAYLEAYRRDPLNPLPLERLGFMQLAPDPPRAQITFEELVEEEPERATAHAGLGLALYAQGKLEPARVSLERAAELDPESPLALSGLAAVYDLQGRAEEANAARGALAALHPRDPRILNNIGVSRMLQGDYAGAEEALRRSVQIDPRNPTSWNNLGLALGYQDQYEEALDAFREGGDEQSAQNNVGYLLYRAGRYDEAIDAYEAALLADGNQKARVLQNLQAALDARDATHDPDGESSTAGAGTPHESAPASPD